MLIPFHRIYSKHQRARPSTYYNKLPIAKLVRNLFGDDTLIENIMATAITKILESRITGKDSTSREFILKYKSFLHQLVEYAKKNTYIEHNPVMT